MSAVLTPPAVRLLTAAEFAEKFSRHRMELVRGIPVETPMPDFRHGKACARMTYHLVAFTEANDLGHVMGNDTFVKVATNPDTLRGGDVLFVSYERLPKGEIPPGVLDVIPELVVEVVSPSNLWTGLFTKVDEYLAAGVNVVVMRNLLDRLRAVAWRCRAARSGIAALQHGSKYRVHPAQCKRFLLRCTNLGAAF